MHLSGGDRNGTDGYTTTSAQLIRLCQSYTVRTVYVESVDETEISSHRDPSQWERVRMSRSSERARRSPFLTRVSICTHCFSIRRAPGYERDSGCIFIIDISIQYQNHQRLVLAKITRDDHGLKNTTMYLFDETIESWGAQLIHRCVQRPHSRRRPRDCDMNMYQYLPCIR